MRQAGKRAVLVHSEGPFTHRVEDEVNTKKNDVERVGKPVKGAVENVHDLAVSAC